jgi:hypothetical protein
MLTKASAKELSLKIQHLINDYTQLAAKDGKVPSIDKMTSNLLVVFKENWEPKIFQQQWN